MKKIVLWVSAIITAVVLSGCGTSMSKKELKTSYFKVQDSYAKVIYDSQTKDTTDKKMIVEAKAGQSKIRNEIQKLNNNKSNKKLTNKILKVGNLFDNSLSSFISNEKGTADKYKNASFKAGQLSADISGEYFNDEYSRYMNKLLGLVDSENASSSSNSDVQSSNSQANSSADDSAEKTSSPDQRVLSNNSIQEVIESADSGIDVESVNGSYTDADSTVQIVLNGRELASNKQAERAMLMDISTVWKTLKDNFDYSKISNIGVSVKYPLKNEGGNTSSEYVIKSDISGNKLDQLNNDGFSYKNVPNFAINWWQSEALPKL